MAIKSPLARVKEEFGGKDKLVDKIVGLLGSQSEDESKDDLRRRLLGAANRKLVRLHGVASQMKELGGKDQLVSAAAQEMGHGKDKDYVEKLGTLSSGRLLDMLTSARRRNRAVAAKGSAKKSAKNEAHAGARTSEKTASAKSAAAGPKAGSPAPASASRR